jgi:hypothetical protein
LSSCPHRIPVGQYKKIRVERASLHPPETILATVRLVNQEGTRSRAQTIVWAQPVENLLTIRHWRRILPIASTHRSDGRGRGFLSNPRQPVWVFKGDWSLGTSGRSYRALVKRSGGPSGGSVFHLIREDSETSLCGIPRAQLSGGGTFDELVCQECVDWLPKRMDFSARHPRVEKS